jgi:outer membrane receptor for monomeric catechols
VRSEDRNETLFDANNQQTGANNADYSATVKRLALFAQDEWQVTKQYSLYLGLRHERLDTASRAKAANAPDALNSRSSVWSPSCNRATSWRTRTCCGWPSAAPTKRRRWSSWCRAATPATTTITRPIPMNRAIRI